jgi:alpha-beta hydrolase superfamily lysophospholipase
MVTSMSADPVIIRHSIATGNLAQPVYFPAGQHQLFGRFLEPQAPSRADLGLVICNPFGYEAVCAHRSIRAFAEAAAAQGIPSLRFDYCGTGDSTDIDPPVDQIQAWSADIVAAVAELQRRTAVRHVCLLGFRLGSLLAALASAKCPAVTALISVAPIISGRRYVRELRTVQMAGASPATPAGAAEAGSLEASGFSLAAASVASLRQIDLLQLDRPPAMRMLVIDRSDLPAAREWTEKMTGLGAQIHYEVQAGTVEMMMVPPYFTVVPQAMVSATSTWLGQLLDALPDRLDAHHTTPAAVAAAPLLMLPAEAAAVSGTVTERPLYFASDPLLFGIVAEPPAGEVRRRAVIIVNDGATHHIGSNRIYVSLARRWAQCGYVVLRMDLAGIGDSATRPGRPDNEVFPAEAVDDIRTAIEFIDTRYGIRDVTLVGLCSGAYHSLRAAVAALPVAKILMINPQNYFWKQGMTLAELQLAEVVRNPSVYRERLFSIAAWRRLLAGEVQIWRIAAVYAQRSVLLLESAVRAVARTLRLRLPRDLGRELEEIVVRGVQVVFVFARGDPGIDLLRIHAGAAVKRLGERTRIHIIDDADHVFSRKTVRTALEKLLSDELFARRWSNSDPAASRK